MDEIFGGCLSSLLYALGRTGAMVKAGINTKSALNKARLNAKRQGATVTPRWHSVNRKAILYIISPLLGWTLVYFVFFWLLSKINIPRGIYILVLLPLIPVILGGLGLVFKPIEEEELEDYIFATKEERKSERAKELVSEIVNKLNVSFVSGDPETIKDQIALLSFVDELITHTPRIKQNEIQKLRGNLINQANEKLFTHLVSLLSERDQKELDTFLDSIPSNKEMWQFFTDKIPNLNIQIANVLIQFRNSYLTQGVKG